MVGVGNFLLPTLHFLTIALAGPVELDSRGILYNDGPVPCTTVYSENPNPRPRLVCNTQGTLGKPMQIDQDDAVSKSDCIALAKQSPGVISFGYSELTETCKLYSKRVLNMQFTRKKSIMEYSNNHCYVGSCTCPDGDHNTLCGDMCANTMLDNLNCGGCGVKCSGFCLNGICL